MGIVWRVQKGRFWGSKTQVLGGRFWRGPKPGFPGSRKVGFFGGFWGGPKRSFLEGPGWSKFRPKNGVFWDDGHDPKDVGS